MQHNALPREHYEQIAREYRELFNGGNRRPNHVIAQRRGVKTSTIGWWVKRARQLGILEPYRVPECWQCRRPFAEEDMVASFRGFISVARIEGTAYKLEDFCKNLVETKEDKNDEDSRQLRKAASLFAQAAEVLGCISERQQQHETA